MFNDAHFKVGNEHEVLESISHLIKTAIERNIDKVVFLGDMFDSRQFQRQSVLEALDVAIKLFHEAGITLYLVPGNHDKTDYMESFSFLEIYRHHPNIIYIKQPQSFDFDGVSVDLVPFFDDEILVPMLEKMKGGDILGSHFEMWGSSHLGKISKKKSITPKLLAKWKKVFLGHFHNEHDITENISHLPALRQNDFGENPKKGFTIVYNDLSKEFIKGVFKEHLEIPVDANKVTQTDLVKLIEQHKDPHKVVLFKIEGEEANVKAIDLKVFEGTGILYKTDYDQSFEQYENVEDAVVVKKHDKESILSLYLEFCENKGYDYLEGKVFVKSFFNKDSIFHYYDRNGVVWMQLEKDEELKDSEISVDDFYKKVESRGLDVADCLKI